MTDTKVEHHHRLAQAAATSSESELRTIVGRRATRREILAAETLVRLRYEEACARSGEQPLLRIRAYMDDRCLRFKAVVPGDLEL